MPYHNRSRFAFSLPFVIESLVRSQQEMEEGLKVGDTVQLKSGGLTMTIESMDTHSGVVKAECVWQDGNKPMREFYALTSLKQAQKLR